MFTCEWSKQLIHSCEWKMQHNCSSLSGLNYVLLAREQVNNTSSVYCSDQPCHLNRRLTKERGNPQFADNVSQELANSNYMAKEGPQVNFAWHSAGLIKGAFASSDWLYLLLLGEHCCGGWELGLHWYGVKCLFPSLFLPKAEEHCSALWAYDAWGVPMVCKVVDFIFFWLFLILCLILRFICIRP